MSWLAQGTGNWMHSLMQTSYFWLGLLFSYRLKGIHDLNEIELVDFICLLRELDLISCTIIPDDSHPVQMRCPVEYSQH